MVDVEIMRPATTPSEYRAELLEMLEDAQANLDRAGAALLFVDPSAAAVLMMELDVLQEQQDRLVAAASGDQNLGWILPVAFGVGSLLTVIGGWAWKQHEETKMFREKAELFKRWEELYGPQKAAELWVGEVGTFEKALNIGLIIGALVAGVWMYSKLR